MKAAKKFTTFDAMKAAGKPVRDHAARLQSHNEFEEVIVSIIKLHKTHGNGETTIVQTNGRSSQK